MLEQTVAPDSPEEKVVSATTFKELIYLLNPKEQEVNNSNLTKECGLMWTKRYLKSWGR